MIGRIIVTASVALVLAQTAFNAVTADEATPDSAGGRYMFAKQAEGFLRLDTQTGEVASCNRQPVGWACLMAPEDRAVLENEIARLRAQNATLKKAILAHGLELPAGVAGEPSAAPSAPAQNRELSLRLPSDADLERVVALVGRAWHSLVEAIERAQKQVFNKG